MQLSVAENWELTDKPIELVFNHTEERVSINVTYEGNLIANESVPDNSAYYYTGQNVHRYSDR